VIRTEIVTSASGLARLQPEWDQLLARSRDDEPMASSIWMLAWWRTYGAPDGRGLRIACFRDGTRLVGILPLTRRIAWHRRAIPMRRLEMLGTGEAEHEEVCSEYVGPLVEHGFEAAVAESIAAALARDSLGAWDEVVLRGLNGDRPLPVLLREALLRHGVATRLDVMGVAPYVPLPRNFDAYLDSLGRSRRSLVRRSLRDFESWCGAPLTLRRATDDATLSQGRSALERLHGERWARAGEAGVFASPRFAGFHDAVMRAFLRRDALDLTWLEAHGEPVAASYSLVWNRRVYFYQGGRRIDLPKRLRPGIVMHALSIRAAIERGDEEYDFLLGSTRYKLALALAARPVFVLRAARHSIREYACRAVEAVAEHVSALRAARSVEARGTFSSAEAGDQYESEGNASTDWKKADSVASSSDMR
jgi:CelD/BcsL family acetyltransferase involved in cellulose biosynthesis